MVKFANGKQIETIAVYGDPMTFQNAYRETLEFRIATENATFDELKGIYTDSAALSEIEITETAVNENGETEITAHSLQLNFTLPVKLALEDVNGEQTWCMKVAQKSELEIAQEQQAADINDTQLALIEIATMIGG
ncbi:MAG: hypothetical protein K2J80_08215 [Oscillospiraceae bacterium]|nr:hypothetical protein [Oscillospiraceae bacterium]